MVKETEVLTYTTCCAFRGRPGMANKVTRTRLKYRYLDCRTEMARNLPVAQVATATRFMMKGLSRVSAHALQATPEGARNSFPCRQSPCSTLAASPQQFKQILIGGRSEKYFPARALLPRMDLRRPKPAEFRRLHEMSSSSARTFTRSSKLLQRGLENRVEH